MKRTVKTSAFLLALLTLITLVFTSCLGQESEQIMPEKTADIDDFERAYFDGLETKTEIDLSEHFDDKGMECDITAESSDPSVASVSVVGQTLTVLMNKGEGETTVTVTVSASGKKAFDMDFTVTARSYKTIACIGDSLTFGHSWHDEAYPVYLQQLLGNGIKVTNYGVNGAAVTRFCTTEKQYKTLPEYNTSLNAAPDIAIFMLGTNDSKLWNEGASVNFLRDYEDMLYEYSEANPDMVTILVTAPPTMDGNEFSIPNDVIKENIVPKQLEIADNLGMYVIDFRDIMENYPGGYESLIRSDGVHLSVAGAQLLAELVGDVIKGL